MIGKLNSDLLFAMKIKDTEKRDTIRLIIGEVNRLPNKKAEDVTEEEVINIIRKMIKDSEKCNTDNQNYVSILKNYLPKQISERDIRSWISENIDFTEFKNKMQAMRPIMAHFKNTVDGNLVKKILEDI